MLVVSQWARRAEVAMRTKLKEVDWRGFKRYHKKLGYKKVSVKTKWAKATEAQAFKSGKARRCGKKILVWINKGREAESSDIISLSQTGEKSESYVSKEQSKQMLRGKHGLQLSDAAKAETFGGVCCTGCCIDCCIDCFVFVWTC